MLQELRVRDFAIIENIRAEFGPGLNVLSGETGAGKSIVVDALALALGGRATGDLVRADAKAAAIEAVFSLHDRPEVRERMDSLGLDPADEIVVRRTVAAGGKGRAHVNGSPVTLAMLGAITGDLVEIHGQYEHQRLLRSETHLGLLDRAAKLEKPRARLAGILSEWRALHAEGEKLRLSEEERLRQIDYLRFQIEEISATDPEAGEDERLAAERARLANSERLLEHAGGAEARLYSGDGALVETLGSVVAALEAGVALDPGLRPLGERLAGALREIEDIAGALRDYAASVVHDPARLATVEDRLEALRKLTRKYGPTLAEVQGALGQAHASLEALEGRDVRIAQISEACEKAVAEGDAIARRLATARKRAASGLARQVCKEIEALGMGKAAFHVQITPETPPPPGFNERGRDRVEFLIAPNPGEPPRPLARIASGGELSRVTLALHTALAASERPATLVFDEADAGVGGRVADAVGQRLAGLASTHQILCLTHLPQIAARGDRHLRVSKAAAGGRTAARVAVLAGEDRVEEIARMSGGAGISDKTRAHARDLLRRAGRK
ncbi:MAG: DNA repair protein RecN [Myxococcota bacterium]